MRRYTPSQVARERLKAWCVHDDVQKLEMLLASVYSELGIVSIVPQAALISRIRFLRENERELDQIKLRVDEGKA